MNEYVEMINKYNQYFDFEKYELLPNMKNRLKYKKDLLDYSDIPRDIIKALSEYDSDFTEEIMHFELKMELQKKNIIDFSKKMNNIISALEEKKKTKNTEKILIVIEDVTIMIILIIVVNCMKYVK
jgi:hypothetical protein